MMSAERIPEIESLARDAPEADGLVREWYNGRIYAYYPIGRYIVSSPGVCGGRPIVKGTRIDARHLTGRVHFGESYDKIAGDYSGTVSREAVEEAVRLEEEHGPEFLEETFVPATRVP
jgi:uncharacterized protein (DUF433 family)